MTVCQRRAGRLFQKGDIEAFGSINKRCRGVGGISIVGGFGVGAHPPAPPPHAPTCRCTPPPGLGGRRPVCCCCIRAGVRASPASLRQRGAFLTCSTSRSGDASKRSSVTTGATSICWVAEPSCNPASTLFIPEATTRLQHACRSALCVGTVASSCFRLDQHDLTHAPALVSAAHQVHHPHPPPAPCVDASSSHSRLTCVRGMQ